MDSTVLNYYGEKLELLDPAIIQGAVAHIVSEAEKHFGKDRLKSLTLLDIGSGRGEFTKELATYFNKVIGVEPYVHAYNFAVEHSSASNISYVHSTIEEFKSTETFDVMVSLTVFEHMPDHNKSFDVIFSYLNPNGMIYLTAPNKYWLFEQHYGLPFLSWLPLPVANKYLQLAKGVQSYEDSSYSKGYFGMISFFKKYPCKIRFVLPDDPNNKYIGYGKTGFYSLVKRLGIYLIGKFPLLWIISKGFIIVIVRD